jgi:hypothetical protein
MPKKKKAKKPEPAKGCEVCGQFPYLSETGMCGPCTHGTADAIGEGDVFGPT